MTAEGIGELAPFALAPFERFCSVAGTAVSSCSIAWQRVLLLAPPVQVCKATFQQPLHGQTVPHACVQSEQPWLMATLPSTTLGQLITLDSKWSAHWPLCTALLRPARLYQAEMAAKAVSSTKHGLFGHIRRPGLPCPLETFLRA